MSGFSSVKKILLYLTLRDILRVFALPFIRDKNNLDLDLGFPGTWRVSVAWWRI